MISAECETPVSDYGQCIFKCDNQFSGEYELVERDECISQNCLTSLEEAKDCSAKDQTSGVEEHDEKKEQNPKSQNFFGLIGLGVFLALFVAGVLFYLKSNKRLKPS